VATTLPANTTKVSFDQGSDDPKSARTEFAANADIQNTLKSALGDFAQLSNQAGSGLEVVSQAGGTPDDIRVANIHERKTANYSIVAGDRGKLIEFDSASDVELFIATAGDLGDGWFAYIFNSGTGRVNINPFSTQTADDDQAFTLGQGNSLKLICDGVSFWTIGRGNSGTEFITTADISNDATIDFEGSDVFLPARYDAYMFILSNVILATDDETLNFRTSTDQGSTYDAGGSDYARNVIGRDTSTTDDTIDSSGVIGAEIVLSSLRAMGSGAAEDGFSGILYIYGPHLSQRTQITWQGNWEDADGTMRCVWGTGVRISGADVNAVRFLANSGNLESGTITMYGMRNA